MTEMMLALSLIAGLFTGVLFYMGLWWTVSKNSAHWWWLSFMIRLMGAASVFYLIANEHIARYALLLLGFLLARKMVFNRVSP